MTAVEVSNDDQALINRFSNLNHLSRELATDIDYLKGRLQACRDASEESELCFDDSDLMMTIGECFVSGTSEDIASAISMASQLSQSSLSEKEGKLAASRTEMSELKSILYGRFGKSINLEDS